MRHLFGTAFVARYTGPAKHRGASIRALYPELNRRIQNLSVAVGVSQKGVPCKMPRSKQLTPEQKHTEAQMVLARIKELERKAVGRSQSVIYQTFAGPSERENERKEAEEILRLKGRIEHMLTT